MLRSREDLSKEKMHFHYLAYKYLSARNPALGDMKELKPLTAKLALYVDFSKNES